MANVIPFAPRPASRRSAAVPDARSTGLILFFTGVRYERQDHYECQDRYERHDEAPPARRKRRPAAAEGRGKTLGSDRSKGRGKSACQPA